LLNSDNRLAKINILKKTDQIDNFSSNEFISNATYWNTRIYINEGIEVYQPDNMAKEPIIIFFGDHLMDVVRLLGNPNKEFYKD
jgi:hypothetical protein